MKSKRVVYPACPVVLFLLCFFLLAPQCARGWGNTWMGASLERTVNSARWKAGLLKYSAALSLNNAGYDSDIYFGNTATRIPDYTVNAGIPFRLFLPIKKKIILDVSGNPQYVFYFKTKNERTLNNDFRGNVHFALGRVYFQAGGGLANVRERMSPELTLNIRKKKNDLNALVLWQISQGESLALQYQTSMYTYDNPVDSGYNISENLNRREDFLNFTAYLQQISKRRFFLDVEYGAYVFKEAISSFKDSRSYGLYGGVEFLSTSEGRRQTRGVQGEIKLGYRYFDILDPQRRDYSGLVGNTSVSIVLMKLTSVQGFFARDVRFSVFRSLTYYLITSYGGGLSRSLTRKSRLEYGLSFSRGVYPSDETIDGILPQDRLIRYTGHSLRAIFQLRRDLEFGLMAGLEDRKGNAILPGRNRYFVGLGLTYGVSPSGVPMLANPFFR